MPGTDIDFKIAILDLSYLVAAILFIIGLKMLSKPATARKGNLWAASGMIFVIITTLFFHKDNSGNTIPVANAILILVIISVSTAIGSVIARRVKMTSMPQMVSLFNATGGAASSIIALTEYSDPANTRLLVTILGMVVGNISFIGSLIAYGKLDGKINDWYNRMMKYINLFIVLLMAFLILYIVFADPSVQARNRLVYTVCAISLIYGVFLVMPIGGADMPVVISLLNSFTGIAVAMAGFIYSNQAMILGGILVGATGTILTIIMCRAMNRSLLNVIVGAFGANVTDSGHSVQGAIREISYSDTAVLLRFSQKVVIVPGYGLAAAQAQHLCSELDHLLTERDVNVLYAIHPVAGRMPGHMNVLLAEANVPYEKLIEMDQINPDMPNVDVVLVIGANDVVNPAAMDDPSSPIYGMPIIRAHEAKNIIVVKRGMGKGYAAIENNLFFNDKTRMLFGNAKDVLQKLIAELKAMD
jgi:NAD(P) transhydrogenase subunit beta